MTKNILILPGDGIGQEVSSSMKELLYYLIEEQSLDFKITERNVGGSSYDEFGTPLTEETLKIAKDSDAILFGAVGGPQWDNLEWDNRPEQALLALRKSLSLFANLRPAFLFNELASASPLKNNIIEKTEIAHLTFAPETRRPALLPFNRPKGPRGEAQGRLGLPPANWL